jgi:hypothetical protein
VQLARGVAGWGVALGLVLWVAAGAAVAEPASPRPLELTAPDGTELVVERFVAQAPEPPLVVWIPSEFGFNPAHRELARRIAARGLEVWLVDLLQAYFVPAGHGALDEVPAATVETVLDAAARHAPGRVFVLTSEGGARLVLDAAWRWQAANPGRRDLRGLVLLHPFLYAGFPEPGGEARFVPEAGLANLPVYLVQPGLTTQAWRLPELTEALRRGEDAEPEGRDLEHLFGEHHHLLDQWDRDRRDERSQLSYRASYCFASMIIFGVTVSPVSLPQALRS